MGNLAFALSILWPEEGGYSNRPCDRGGATMYGVTQRTYDAWRDSQSQAHQSVSLITKFEATNLYAVMFWGPAGCAQLPKRLACMQFDTAVNSGPGQANRLLARAGLNGATFPDSVAEDNGLKAYAVVRKAFYSNIVNNDPSQEENLNGWQNRVNNLLNTLLTAEA